MALDPADFQIPEEAMDAAQIRRSMLLAGYGDNPTPPTRPVPPDARLGPLRFSGQGLDNASLAVLASLRNAPAPRGFGQSFAAGLAGGLAGGRARDVAQRESDFQDQQKEFEADQRARRAVAANLAAGLARHRWDMQRDAARDANRQPPAKANTIHVSSDPNDPYRVWAKANNIAVAPGELDLPTGGAATRDMSQGQSPLAEQLGLSLLEQRRQAAAQKKLDDAQRQDNIESSAQGVADFSLTPDRVPRDKDFHSIENRANQLLAAPEAKKKANGQPYTVRELQQMKREADNFYRTMDQQQMVGFRQAATTARQHLDQFQQFFAKYADRKPPTNIRALNKGTFQLAHEGLLGEDAQADAQGLDPVMEALPVEIAKVIAGNRVPYEGEVKAATGAKRVYVDPFLKPGPALAKLKSTKQLIEARIKSQMSAMPYAGGPDNPYLLDVSPIQGWSEGALPMPQKPGQSATGHAAEFQKNHPELFR